MGTLAVGKGFATMQKSHRIKPLLLTGVVIAGALALSACATLARQGPSGNAQVPQPAKAVDLDRYLGRWYELARYEFGFQKDCEAVTADYRLLEDGQIGVVNGCHQDAVEGPYREATAKAKVVEGSNNAKLKLSFFGPLYVGDYWVLDHADDYSWSIVGEPSGRNLWILTREAKPSQEARRRLYDRAGQLGYDLSMLRETQH